MTKSNIKIQGTPWHSDQFHSEEGDERRHRSRCIHYYKKTCALHDDGCWGASHCPYYKEGESSNNKQTQTDDWFLHL